MSAAVDLAHPLLSHSWALVGGVGLARRNKDRPFRKHNRITSRANFFSINAMQASKEPEMGGDGSPPSAKAGLRPASRPILGLVELKTEYDVGSVKECA